MVDEAIRRVESGGGEARAKLRRLFALARGTDELTRVLLRTDLAVRDWARHDAAVAKRLRRVDGRRMEYMRALFGEFCRDADDVEARCLLAFALFVGSPFIGADHGDRTRGDDLELALRKLLES